MEELRGFKAGDTVYLQAVIEGEIQPICEVTIRGFAAYGVLFNNHHSLHFAQGLFYGFGYHNDGYYVMCKRKEMIPMAHLCEDIRRLLPEEESLRLRLEL